jgi:formylglycine-generating enzyme required for sulfatase activity
MIPSGDRYRKVAASLVPVLAAVAVTIVAFLGAGCDEKMQPLPPPFTEGIIKINAEPDAINAHWILTGPKGSTGNGDKTLPDQPFGDYTLTWGTVAGWTKPEDTLGTLAVGTALTLSGTYVVPGGPFVLIPAGSFTMGSPTTEPGRNTDETQHQVTLTHGIYVQTTEVTNQQYMDMAQWAYDHGYARAGPSTLLDNLDGSTWTLAGLSGAISEGNDITFSNGIFSCINPDHPVTYVTWYGAVAYCDWLSLQQGLPRAYYHLASNPGWQCNSGNPYAAVGYRLPTEAEWEYACRAGSTTAFANGPITQLGCSPIDPNLDMMGWYCGSPSGGGRAVAQKTPNAWGLYDMHGNVWEWCNDSYGSYGGNVTDPVGSGTDSYHVLRGGSGWTNAQSCRSAQRRFGGLDVIDSYFEVGFRPVRSAP